MAKPLGAMRGTRIGSNPAGPRLDGTCRWRDPARLSQERRAELEAHDRKFSAPGTLTPHPRAATVKAAAAANRAVFARLRDEGKTVAEATQALGLAASTGRRYERERRRAAVR